MGVRRSRKNGLSSAGPSAAAFELVRRLVRLHGGDSLGAILARGGAGSLAVGVGAAALGLAAQLLLTRFLGITHYGVYVYALSWLTVLGFIARLGLDNGLIRFVSVYRAESSWALLRGLLRSASRISLAFAIAISLSMATLVWRLGPRLDTALAQTLWIASFGIPVVALLGLRQGALRGLRRVVLAQLPELILAPTLLIVGLLLLSLLWPGALSGATAMLLHLAALTLVFVLASFWLRRCLPRTARSGAREFRNPEWIRTSLPLLFIGGMAMVLAKTDVLMIGAWLGTTEAGNYAVAVKLTRLVTFGLAAATTIASPMIAESYSRNDREALQRIARLSAIGILVFTLPVALVLAGLGRVLLAVFDASFVAAYVPMIILLFGHFFNALAGSVSFFLTMTGHQMGAASVAGAAAAANIVLNALLVPRFGMTGAAIATATSIVMMNLLLVLLVRRRIGIDPTVLSLLPRKEHVR